MRSIRCAAVVLVASLGTVYSVSAADEPVAARVNGITITRAQVDRLAESMATAQRTSPDAVRDKALQALINIEVLLQKAKADKIKVPAAEVDQRLGEIKNRYPSPEAYQQALADNRVTEAHVRDDLARTLLVEKVLDRHVTVQLAPDAAEQFYKANPDRFRGDAEVRASHILFLVPQDADGSAAKQRAADALARIKQGEDFGALAKELSDDPGSKDKDGDLGFLTRRKVVKEFADAAFALPAGEVSDIVQTTFGYHIIKVTEVRDASLKPFAEVRSGIENYLRQQELEKQQGIYVEGLKKRAKIDLLEPQP